MKPIYADNIVVAVTNENVVEWYILEKDYNEKLAYNPSILIDFDNRIFMSHYAEPESFEFFVPDGWEGKYRNFEMDIPQIKIADTELKLDWDDGAGEKWARFYNLTDGIVCMVNAKLGLVFMRKKYKNQDIKNILKNLEVVFTENYYSSDWTIDVSDLKKEIPEIYWHASEDAVNTNGFSLDDFYFATV